MGIPAHTVSLGGKRSLRARRRWSGSAASGMQNVKRNGCRFAKHKGDKMKSIPNLLSFGRIVLSLVLVLFEPLSLPFYIIYVVSGLTDIFDGMIAKKLAIVSKFGARLDSIADFIMICVVLVLLYPIINPSIWTSIWIVCICLLRFTSVGIAFKKYKTPASIHTYGNKLTGILLFIYPLLLPVISSRAIVIIICVIASASAVEELMIQLTSSQLQLDKRSIFIKEQE